MTHRFIKGLIMFLIGCMILLLPILVNLGDIIGVPIIIGSMIAIIGVPIIIGSMIAIIGFLIMLDGV